MNLGLPEEVIRKIKTVFGSFPQVKQVLIYGSRAKGNWRTGSDIDLTIKGDRIDLHTLNKISATLEELHTPYTFDLSVFEDLENPDLIEHIERVGKAFYP